MFLMPLAMALVPLSNAPAAQPHNSNHDYVFQSNGAIRIGRDPNTGGAIVWVSDDSPGPFSGNNLVNNYGNGRQIQVTAWDGPCFNPTQGGHGYGGPGIPDGNNLAEILHLHQSGPSDTGVTYSKATPRLFNNPSCVVPGVPNPPVDVVGHSIHMWTELLPDSDGRAFLVKTLYVDDELGSWVNLQGATVHGGSRNQKIIPTNILNQAEQWESPCASAPTVPSGLFANYEDDDGDGVWEPNDLLSGGARLPENWMAYVADVGSNGVDANDWGLAVKSSSEAGFGGYFNPSLGTTCDSLPGGCDQDHLNQSVTYSTLERFQLSLTPGVVAQHREARSIYYLGELDDARDYYLAHHAPVVAGSVSDKFDANVADPLYQWDKNSADVTVVQDLPRHPSAVRMMPNVGLADWEDRGTQDLSLRGKYFDDATYEFSARFEAFHSSGGAPLYSCAGTGPYDLVPDYYGMAFRKGGDIHGSSLENWTMAPPQFQPDGITGFYLLTVRLEPDDSLLVELRSSDDFLCSTLDSISLPSTDPRIKNGPMGWQKWRVESTGSSFDVYINDDLILEAEDLDASFSAGYCSLVAGPNSEVLFDDFSVVCAGDGTPPSQQPANLQAVWQSPLTTADSVCDGLQTAPWSTAGFRLSWINIWVLGAAPDMRWTRVVRKEGTGQPLHYRDGICVYEGKRMNCFDADTEPGQTYTYRAFTVDGASNYRGGSPLTVTAP